ncbi:MAG: hypothetical protein IJE23_04640 [Tyzzerella sp.]|nr:hypothetical protein [Tyzzerella sp.]
MRETAHKQSRYLNCLRIAIVPEYHEEQRIKNIVDFCKKHKFDNVMLFINAEEYNLGHMTCEEAKPWLAAMKRAKAAFVEAGITVSMNPWIEMGHLDRGRSLRPGQDFVTMCDYNGTESKMVACPMDENWITYFLEFYELLIREVKPEVVWIEDDFRFHNHGFLEYGGCFCKHHMKAFNDKLGTNYTREEFVDRLFRKYPNEAVKRAFMEVNRECLSSLAEKIGKMVHDLGLGTKIGLMSSGHPSHSMEYRDWKRIHEGFAQGGTMINRLHMPMYVEDCSMKKYYMEFNQYPFVCRGYLPKECHVLPELENSSFSTFAKDSETLRFQVESAIPLEMEGMTYDIFDFVGNGAIEAYGYGEAISGITDYLTAVWESGYSYHDLSGVTILLDEKNAYNRPITNHKFMDLRPDEFVFGSFLQAHGISARCSKEKEFRDQVIVLAMGSVHNFNDNQLKTMFEDNHVILEGGAAKLLIDRGMGHLIGAKAYREYVAHVDCIGYEEIEGETLVLGIPGCRATAFKRTGNYVSISYEKTPECLSRVYTPFGDEMGYGMVKANGHLIIPYVVNSIHADQMHPLRGTLICNYIDSLKKEFVRADYSNIYAYYSKAEKNVLILVNTTHNTLPVTRFKMTGGNPSKIYEIERDGNIKEKAFSIDTERFVVIEEAFVTLTTKTFIIEE